MPYGIGYGKKSGGASGASGAPSAAAPHSAKQGAAARSGTGADAKISMSDPDARAKKVSGYGGDYGKSRGGYGGDYGKSSGSQNAFQESTATFTQGEQGSSMIDSLIASNKASAEKQRARGDAVSDINAHLD